MKKTVVILALVLASAAAQAEVQFSFSGLVGLTGKGFERIFINPTADGKLKIRSSAGEETVNPKVIEDRRSSDGNLVLDLGKNRKMTVTSGFSPDGKIQFILEDGTSKVELNPLVSVDAK